MCMRKVIPFPIILMLHQQSLLRRLGISLSQFLLYPRPRYSFLAALAFGLLPSSFILYCLPVCLFILTLGFNYSFVIIVFVIVGSHHLSHASLLVGEQVVDGTCKQSVVCTRAQYGHSDKPPGGIALTKMKPSVWGF